MAKANPITFTRLANGTLLQRHPDGTFRPVASATNHARLAALDDTARERMAVTDPDHPGLDDGFWAAVGHPTPDR